MADKNNNIYVNLYIPAVVNIDNTKLEISDGYLQTGEVFIKASTKSPKTMKFRIPSWSKKFSVDGKSYTGEWAEVKFEGDKKFCVKFDFTPRIVHSNLKPTNYPQN